MKLGKLKEVNIRKVWGHEQYGFSAWLSNEENINELGEILGLNLTDIKTEQFVGNYRCDIICKDEISDKIVLIENQLEATNHDHLGKIITYASGLDAAVIVWIVESAREEHASAIEWLNKHTDETVDFFLIEVHAYQIGDSQPAPQFKIIEQPNDFSKNIKALSKTSEVGEIFAKTMSNRLNFWTKFNEFIDNNGKPLNKHKATTDHWYNVAMGSSKCHISIDLINKDHKIRVGVWIPDCKELFDIFYANKEEIQASVSFPLFWDRLEMKKASLACSYIEGLDFEDTSNYNELMAQIVKNVIELKNAFKKYL
ncbi:MAG: DUF4268 domain-containing protein [Candidatus Borkfalkiaceae bacterium]|nr:DUF4268 domain-containing protein [Christensenellaceae bacterium]